jgi:hypothetical protein
MRIFIILIFLTSPVYANINSITGWGGQDLSVVNEVLRAISSKTGIQQINTLTDLSSTQSISILNENISMIGRQLSIYGLSPITAYNDNNLSVLNDDLAIIGQNTGA